MCHEQWMPAAGLPEPDEITVQMSDGVGMPGWTYRAAAAKARCVVLPDIFGPSPFYHYVTAQLADVGYDATLLDYFMRVGPLPEKSREAAFARRSQMNEHAAIDDIITAIDALSDPSDRRTGLIGFCLTGTYAWDIATMRSDLAIVTYYGFPEGPGGQTKADAPRPIDVVAEMSGPILSFWGDGDHIPMSVVAAFGAKAARCGVDYRQQVFPGVGHGFLEGLVEDGAATQAARDAWKQTVAFFDQHLGSS